MKRIIMMLIIISTLYSCEKENSELSQKNNYNFKNDNISYSFNKMNKNGTIDTTLNKFIDHFKDYDKNLELQIKSLWSLGCLHGI